MNRQEIVDWIADFDWDTAITLTFNEGVSRAAALKTGRHYWNLMDKAVYGHAAVRFNKRTQRVCFIEAGANNTNWHYHIIANTPDRYSKALYRVVLKKKWQKLGNTGHINEFTDIQDVRKWAGYISKCVTHDCVDSFDTHSSYVTG